MNVFAFVKPKAGMSLNYNFQDFWSSCLTLLRMSTGEEWNRSFFILKKIIKK